MWTSTIHSQTPDHPTPRDVIAGLLGKLVAEELFESWAHFELEKRTGRIARMFAGIEESVEVALTKKRFEMLLIKASRDIVVPSSWSMHRRDIFHIPLAEQKVLIEWIDDYFQPLLVNNPNYTIKGWLDGL